MWSLVLTRKSVVLQEILKQHTLPRLLTNHESGLWLNFVEKAVAFERQMAPLQGIHEAAQPALDQPVLWRRGGCIATICSVEVHSCPHALQRAGRVGWRV